MIRCFHIAIKCRDSLLLTLLSTVVLCIVACGGEQQTRSSAGSDADTDSIIHTLHAKGDYSRMLAIIDSMETDGHIKDMKANRLKATAYLGLKQGRTAEIYLRKVLEASIQDDEDMREYLFSAAELSNILVNKGDYEGAMQAAVPAVGKIREEGKQNGLDLAILLESIGRCQLSLGRDSEAAATYDEAYRCYQQNATEDTTAAGMKDVVVNTYNTALSYLSANHYAEASTWTELTDSMVSLYEQRANANAAFAAQVKALVSLQRATAMQGLGHKAEAAKAYQEFLNTDYGHTADGSIDATRYLVLAERYAEAADNFRQLDQVLERWGYDLSFNNVQRFLFPKFRANVGAGRTDSAIAVGFQMIDALDTAIVQAKRNDAAELAVIYETQGQQMQIAHNRASLLRYKLIGLFALFMIVVTFFVVYSLHKRKTTKKLAEAHRKLADTNAMLEDSNRQLAEKNSQLTTATARAKEASDMKTLFIKQISHEIRTPLNILSGFTQVVTAPDIPLDDKTRKDISSKIVESTERIASLTNKMLELSEANSHTVIERTDLVTAEQIALQATQESGINTSGDVCFDCQVSAEAEGLEIRTNAKAAGRALTLLLDNARKFTMPAEAYGTQSKEGRMEHVWLKVEYDKEAAMVRFVVEDTGIGIPPEEAERVFDEFVQLDQYYDGTGIGLTVARSLARRLGGDIVVDTSYHAPTALDADDTGSHRGARLVMTLPATT